MEGEDRRAWRVIQGYVSAQLQSRLVAVETAAELQNSALMLKAARDFFQVSKIAYRLSKLDETVPTSRTHTLRSILSALHARNDLGVQRTRRFPRVYGDETAQLAIIRELLNLIPGSYHVVRFRQRTGRIVMAIESVEPISELLTLSSRNPLLYALRHTSLASVQGLCLARECTQQRLGIYLGGDTLYVHFTVVTQLTLQL